ncbi:esterase family protein [Arthrobacter sp. I2-34]|uniref:Esterase family protein n=1 Tax=Arthrobacter hankyongi TaxID=2904801 RepID=A0ABS9LDL4_9MICC|nr:alpha/beta hydrolase-fold protein [Arthrobacter hankyongi]MCG2624666.1 esterase family protein [Arthrobacter hankyongi]
MPFYELTAWPVLALSLLLLTVSVVVAVAVLPRHRTPGLAKYLLQAVAIVLVSLLTLWTLFLKLNADNQWYASWADLFADGATGPARTAVVGAPLRQVSHPTPLARGHFSALQRHPASNPAFGASLKKTAPNGQWVSFAFSGPTTGITRQVELWLPPSYLARPDQAYPVITAFSGYPGSPSTYAKSLHYGSTVMDQVRHGLLREPIVVVPDMYPANLDTECVNGSEGKYESYVADDLVPWIRTNLRTVDNPQAWATSGYSAGGWCASMFSVRHPKVWANSINFAGYFSPDYSPRQHWVRAGDPRYNLGQVVARHKPDVAIWFFSGGEDRRPLRSLASFRPHVEAPTTLVTNITPFGGHRLDVWRQQVGASLAWLGGISGYFAAR